MGHECLNCTALPSKRSVETIVLNLGITKMLMNPEPQRKGENYCYFWENSFFTGPKKVFLLVLNQLLVGVVDGR
jgi:hypothetical protein